MLNVFAQCKKETEEKYNNVGITSNYNIHTQLAWLIVERDPTNHEVTV